MRKGRANDVDVSTVCGRQGHCVHTVTRLQHVGGRHMFATPSVTDQRTTTPGPSATMATDPLRGRLYPMLLYVPAATRIVAPGRTFATLTASEREAQEVAQDPPQGAALPCAADTKMSGGGFQDSAVATEVFANSTSTNNAAHGAAAAKCGMPRRRQPVRGILYPKIRIHPGYWVPLLGE